MPALHPQSLVDAGLTADEVSLLARIYFDGFTQREIAEADDVDQALVSRRHQAALAKLQSANVPLPQRPPARHRRRDHRPTCEPVDPALLNRLRPGRAGRFHLGPNRRIVDCRPSHPLAGGR